MLFCFILCSWILQGLSSSPLKCPYNGTTIDSPVSSRGLAKSCCTVYPYRMGKHRGGFFESGDKEDPFYVFKRKLLDNDIVYVATADFPDFLTLFASLPSTTQITLVTGSEDIGTPFELFHPSRGYRDYSMDGLWPHHQIMSMETFLNDKRLKKWYAQNYDLIGCNLFTCSTFNQSIPNYAEMVNKVIPIPIGLDLHTMGEKSIKSASKINHKHIRRMECTQVNDLLDALNEHQLPFQSKKRQVFAEFDCSFGEDNKFRTLARGQLCNLLKQAKDQDDPRFTYSGQGSQRDQGGSDEDTWRSYLSKLVVYSGNVFGGNDPNRSSRINKIKFQKMRFWKALTKSMFSFAPPGYGQDTHRLWEILNMRTVPITISSPLDKLYREYPIIIVKDWKEAFVPGALEAFEKDILTRFGKTPFCHKMMKKLSLQYWVEQIKGDDHV